MSDFSSNSAKEFFDTILKGESVTYNDHNWYTNSGLKGYIQGRSSKRYPLLNKDLSEYTIGEVMAFQSKPRNSNGQLWATGRYQIIPSTLKGEVTTLKIPNSQKYDKKTQDQLGIGLLLGRTNAKKYLTQQVDDTKANLEKASLDIARIWSSVGVPYAMQGHKQQISKNQSYYAGGGDVASVKTEVVQDALKKLRKAYGTSDSVIGGGDKGGKLGKVLLISSIGLILVGAGIFVYDKFFSKKTK
jgi:hypothetical protein